MIHKGRRLLACIMAAAMTILMPGLNVSAAEAGTANTNIIYEKSTKQTVTQGVTTENIVRFTTSGWLNINILRVDLSNKYIKVDTITNPDFAGKLTSTKTLAVQSNAVAAVNASFFTPSSGGTGYPIGPIIQSGELISANSEHNKYSDSMASFSLTKLNKVMLDYWKTDISLVAPNDNIIPVARYNKVNGSQFTDITIMDRKWSSTSVGASAALPDIVEMVVKNGRVSQFLTAQPAVEIPEDGYVVVTRTAGGKQLTDNFKVGDKVKLDIKTTPDWDDKNMSVTGGAILVKDGQIPQKFSYDVPYISQKQPRTVVASTKDGKTLLLVTVDGRQDSSIGMTQPETAQFMLGIGAYNALNMDGGGSTTMVARNSGDTALSVLNSPSDGLARGISTAIGVFSIAPPSALAGITVDTADANVFVNTSRGFTVKGYDQYLNPVPVNPATIKWSVSGVKGTFSGNFFRPSTAGEAKVVATVGSFKASIPVSVLSAPAKLVLDTNAVKLPIGQTKSFSIKGINKNGFSAIINPVDVKWTVKGNMGTVSNTVFTATAKGAGYIDAAVGSTHAYATVSVAADTTTTRDNFEAPNGAFLSYPEAVKGSYAISTEQKNSGKASGKLTYDFTMTEGTRAAYMVLSNGGLTLEAGASKLGLSVYNDHENSNWLRAEIVDAKGQKHLMDIAKNLDWTGWKQVSLSLDNLPMPAKLTRLYLAQVNPVAESGAIYLDDLFVTNSGYPAVDMTKVPKDTVPVDDAFKAVSFSKATADSFRFSVLGQSREAANPLEKQLITKFAEKVEKAGNLIDAAVIIGKGSHESVSKLIKKKEAIAVNTVDLSSTKEVDYKYGYTDYKNSRFFEMDIRKNGMRLSDPAQWQQFQKDLASFKGSNAFILLENSPENFSDKLELDLLKQTLIKYKQTSGKNVWVFFKGEKNESYMEKGIRYISTAGYEVPGLAAGKTDPAAYVLVTVKGNTVTYTFKPIIS